jgi:hypothetical protein
VPHPSGDVDPEHVLITPPIEPALLILILRLWKNLLIRAWTKIIRHSPGTVPS